MISKIRYFVGFVGIILCCLSSLVSGEIRLNVGPESEGSLQGKWRIIIVAEPDDLGLRAGHPAYKRANNAIFTQLQRAGFDVLSLAADKTLPLCLMDVCKQQTEQDIIALAAASTADIDLVILFSVRYVERVGAGIIHREISVPSRMIDVKSGRRVGLWDDDGVLTEPIPEECVDRCLQSALSDYARQIGRDSGLAIATKLQEYQRWFDYRLTFLKFAKGELFAFEQYFQNSFKSNFIRATDNKVDRKVDKEGQSKVLLHTVVNRDIIIESLLSPPKFRQSLEQVLDEEGFSANIQTNGYEFIVHREGLPYVWRYIFTIIMLLILLAVFYFRYMGYQHSKVLARLAGMKQSLIDQTLSNQPLDKPEGTNPYLLLMQVNKLLSSVRGGLKIQQQISDVCVARDAYIRALPVLRGRSTIQSEKLITPVNVLVGGNVWVGRCGVNVEGSYASNTGDNNIVIGFSRLSHLGKQNKIERFHDGFTLVDEGSSNGSFLDGSLMVAGRSVSLTRSEHILCLGGSREPLEPGVCQLRLHGKVANKNSLFIEIDKEAVALADPAMLNKHWPNLEYDQTQQWLMLGGALDIGVDGSGYLDVGCLRDSTPLAVLSYYDQTTASQGRCPGYWLEPLVKASGEPIEIFVDQTPIFTTVPLIQGANISIDGVSFSFISDFPISASL